MATGRVAIPSATVNDCYAWSSPLVTGGTIDVGVSAQCDVPLVRGGLDEFADGYLLTAGQGAPGLQAYTAGGRAGG